MKKICGRKPAMQLKKPVTKLGKLIYLHRKINGITLSRLGRKLKLSETYLSHIERGQVPCPIKYANRISKVLSVPKNKVYRAILETRS